jgi:quercetin dioxygenase-like cupin family protein
VAKTGDVLEMPDGSKYEVTKSTEDAGGEFVEMVFHLPPGSVAPPPHTHPGLVESYEVLEGELDVMVDGDWRTLGPGDSASVPSDTDHTFKNRSGALVKARNVHRPPARFEDYIAHISHLLDARGIHSGKDPRVPIYLSMVMLEYPDTLVASRTPHRIGMRALAGLGRLLRMNPEVAG